MKRCYIKTCFTLNKKVKAKTKTVKHILDVFHRSNGWKLKKILMHHTLINTGLKGIFPVITGTYIKPLCPIKPLPHPTPLSPFLYGIKEP
jgi:hypothetical protein